MHMERAWGFRFASAPELSSALLARSFMALNNFWAIIVTMIYDTSED